MGKFVVSFARDVLGVEPYIEIRKDNCFVVKSGKEQVRRFFGQYGFTRGRKAGIVQVPRKVMESEKSEIWVGFLRGAFSSDGSFWFDGNSGQRRFEVSVPVSETVSSSWPEDSVISFELIHAFITEATTNFLYIWHTWELGMK